MVHLIIKNTTPVCNLFACYLDVESRAIQDKTSEVWHKLQEKMDAAIDRGEAAILLGDLKWIRHLTVNQGIAGSSPAKVTITTSFKDL